MKNVRFPSYNGDIDNFDFENFKRNNPNIYQKCITSFIKLDGVQSTKVLNMINAFSTYFTSEVADEKIAFDTVGLTYISTITDYYPIICILRNDPKKLQINYYENICELSKIWSDRLKKYSLEEEIKQVKSKLDTIKKIEKIPIGVRII